jgi:hypothetical protein
MQPFKVVIPHLSRDIFCHKLTRWLLNFKYPVMFQTAKKTFNHCIDAPMSSHAALVKSLSIFGYNSLAIYRFKQR